MKSLAVLVEGEGDKRAMPEFVKRAITHFNGWDCTKLSDRDPPHTVGNVNNLLRIERSDITNWQSRLQRLATVSDFGGALVVLDGDIKKLRTGDEFCECHAARELIQQAMRFGAGHRYSVAIVFAKKEFESWLLASVSSISGKAFSDGRKGLKLDHEAPPADIENRRDAKGWFRRNLHSGYKEVTDQVELARLANFDLIRPALWSFRRFEHAVEQLVEAFRTGNHIATPSTPIS